MRCCGKRPRADGTKHGRSWKISSDNGFYYLLLIITVLAVAALAIVNRGL